MTMSPTCHSDATRSTRVNLCITLLWVLHFIIYWPGFGESAPVKSFGRARSKYVVVADSVNLQPAYENSVNPFLSHIEQGSNLIPVKQRYFTKNNTTKEDFYASPLEMDPSKAHFIDSDEADAESVEEYGGMGNDEKNLQELFAVLFSSDY